ncbi:MFS transporter [Pseudomaricurvus alkylphenolicus]|jgi:nitrate/nitrite transporter NarK|uniref:MFS transporter n=1 Tax=Pseudomaricurvus alkylphenolicus TaxID=1306991 RepID=UPI0014220B70|nr:MFS transporter [Pseudomaricurvus alkylphenolicus]NIB40476.1 MFS transporter [Pseudomaricurvus alkylphenolicus]
MVSNQRTLSHYAALVTLIIAGEIIFSLPFHVPRFFRPTLLEVFSITNTQLGDIFALYGVVAMLSYFPGGWLADRFSARTLMTMSLLATAMGGFVFVSIPSQSVLFVLFAFWGLTSILLFWAALIKSTREWAGAHEQGLAFGFLDGGRGMVASILASLAVLIMGLQWVEGGSAEQQSNALQSVILFYAGATALTAALVIWLLPPATTSYAVYSRRSAPSWKTVFSNPAIGWQAVIVVCAYCGYKGLDNYGIFAVQVLGMSQLDAAAFTANASYTRPIAAIAAGLLADRWITSRLVSTLFGILALAFVTLILLSPMAVGEQLVIGNLLLTFIAVYALRAVYFALLEESNIHRRITGSAVGLISVIGFTPDIFFAPITGRLLDANPGTTGFQHYFLFLSLCSVLGLIAALRLKKSIP